MILQGDEAREFMRRAGGSSDTIAWLSCPGPRVYAVREQAGEYAVLVVGQPPEPGPTAADCRIQLGSGQGLDATFAETSRSQLLGSCAPALLPADTRARGSSGRAATSSRSW